jgi:starvation-inducible DNA-binding protein
MPANATLEYSTGYNAVAKGLGVSEKGFDKHTEHLEQAFRNTYDIYLKTLYYHWNFKGRTFMVIHEFLEQEYTRLAANLDEQAERLRILGVKSRMPQNTGENVISLHDDVPQHDAMLKELRDDHYAISSQMREAIECAEEVSDTVTADMFTAMLAGHEKAAWFCDASLSQGNA